MTFIWSLITLIFVERREDAADKFTQIFSMQSIFSDEKTMFLFFTGNCIKNNLKYGVQIRMRFSHTGETMVVMANAHTSF